MTVSLVCSAGAIEIIVLPTTSDEQQESFTVSLISSTGNVAIDSSLSSVVITVQQNGSPFGTVSFLGDAITTQRVMEQDTSSTLSLPLERDGGLSASVSVSYLVSRSGSNEQAQLDVAPVSGTAVFPAFVGRTTLDLTILQDDTPEQDETFSVTLLSATGGAAINPLANTATFIIK